jgi:hypothetical protein
MENRCCFIDGEKQCEKKAEFEISENTRQDPDNFTQACSDHVGELLGTTEENLTCSEWTVRAIA